MNQARKSTGWAGGLVACVALLGTIQLAWAEHSEPRLAALAAVREALAARQLATFEDKLKTASALKGESAYDTELARLELLTRYVKAFWEAVDEGATQVLNQGELEVDGKPIAVVDYDRRLFVIRSEGENKRYGLSTLPAKLALVLAERRLPQTKTPNQVCFGAFLAMDGRGNRDLARKLWQTAGAAGGDVQALLPELEMPLAALPVELPELTPAARIALAPAQWQLRITNGGKVERESLGKLATTNEAGRLEIGGEHAQGTQLVNKTRIAGDFSCRLYLEGVQREQAFGLYPAVPSESAVVVPLPPGTVKVEFARKKGVYYCRVNDKDLEVKPAAKSAERLAGYLGVELASGKSLVVASYEFLNR